MGSGISNNLKGQNVQQEIQQQNLYNNQQDNNLQSSRKNSITGNNYDEAPLLQTMEIYVSCENLQNMDIISDSDPQVKLQKEKNGEWEDIGVTEIIPDNLDPKFATPFILTYDIDRPPKLRLEVYDVDKCQSVKKAIEIDEMGEAECNLQDLLEAKDNFLQLRLTTITKSQKKKEKIKQNSKSETQIKKKNPTSNRQV
ncbi:C2 domain [Pseudocohnilembus persalinus]|uniref:C2 domain n=1 Tax=Pseudocohnilembus persalinus TaxID=266149 RepID=A0A0V0R5I8_PSEPJ|nr:C2 domain [Pseudocohnilembus persalinus]|eukprot:KRX09762.1 C2 domain [Pseudocohnilembus persalinus]